MKRLTGPNVRSLFEKKDFQGRLHGSQPCFGTGGMVYDHGRLVYMDDGNGNEWMEGCNEFEEFDEGW